MTKKADYKNYSTRDFAWDDDFRRWVLHSDMKQDAFWNAWLREHPEKQTAVAIAREVLLALKIHEPEITDREISRITQKVLKAVDSEKSDSRRPFLFRLDKLGKTIKWTAAALVLFVLGISLWFFAGNNRTGSAVNYADLVKHSPVKLTEKVNASQAPLAVKLEDGSEIVLEKDAKVSYAASFNDLGEREVYLSGEAVFKVAKSPSKPFIVYSNGLITRVLGTSFKIRSEEIEDKVTVEVLSGIVSVYSLIDKTTKGDLNSGKLNSLVLTRNQKASYSVKDNSLIASIVENPELAKELKNNYHFSDTAIDSIFRAIHEGYGIEIIYDKKAFSKRTLTADLNNADLYQKLNIICRAANARYEVIDGKIIIYNNF